MLRTKRSDKLGGLLIRFLPEGLASKAVRVLGLRVPTTPTMLAISLTSMTNSMVRQLDSAIGKMPEAFKRTSLNKAWADDVVPEVLCAFYSQSVAVLFESEAEDKVERSFFQIYTAKAFEELCRLLPAANTAISIRELTHETSDLYFDDQPSLAELAQQMPEYVLERELRKVHEKENWMATFALKAKIRILARLGTKAGYAASEVLGLIILNDLLHSGALFRRLRPVLEGLE